MTGKRRPPSIVSIGFALLVPAVLVAWAVPISSIALVWPFLFLIPGWLLVSRVAPRLGPAGRLGVGIVVSTFATAHLANVIGLAVELSTLWLPTELKNAVALAALIVMLLWRPQGLLGSRERIG